METIYLRDEENAELVNLDTFEEMLKLGTPGNKSGAYAHFNQDKAGDRTPHLGASPNSLQTMESNGRVTQMISQKSINFTMIQRALQSSLMKRVINKKV